MTSAWQDDKLNRREEAEALLRFISGRMQERRDRKVTASYVLNLNSEWGHGKSFFLTNLHAELKQGGHPVALVNAWASDFSEAPMVAIMSAIDDGLKPFLGKTTVKKAWNTALQSGGTLVTSLAKNVGSKLVSKYAGDIADDVADAVFSTGDEAASEDGDDEDELGVEKGIAEAVEKLADSALARMMKAFRTQERSIATFKVQLAKVAQSLRKDDDSGGIIYVLVDELDRCRPTYAISLLEAVKHLFDTDGVVFIVATDTEQLAESVKAVYGVNFDSRRYLYRFFDRTYRFRQPDRSAFVQYMFSRYAVQTEKFATPTGSAERLSLLLFQDFDLSLRDIEQCFDILQTVSTIWEKEVPLQLGYLWALIILFHKNRRTEYRIVSGEIQGKLEKPLIASPSVVMENRTVPFGERPRTVRGTTQDLLDAYMTALSRPLFDFSSEGSNPVTNWVNRQMLHEHQVIHRGLIHHNAPGQLSVIREYRSYIELAVRFGKEDERAGGAE